MDSDTLIDDSFERTTDAEDVGGEPRTENRLTLSNLSREHLFANFSCLVTNSKLLEPIRRHVMLDLNREYAQI